MNLSRDLVMLTWNVRKHKEYDETDENREYRNEKLISMWKFKKIG